MARLRSLDVCSGAGGLALGLERAGFDPVLLLDNKGVACETVRVNRPRWNVLTTDLLDFDPVEHQETYDVDLLSAGPPRVKASAANGRLSSEGEERLLEATVLLMHAVQPRALLLENVPELATSPAYAALRARIESELTHLGYGFHWFVLNAADFGVAQDRKHGVLVALGKPWADRFVPPAPTVSRHASVGSVLRRSMRSRGWPGADEWAARAISTAPTLVGGSENRGGADLGPRGSKRAWKRMGVEGKSLADEVPGPDTAPHELVRLTPEQAALLQGFPEDWRFAGRKTARYRQIGHASPPPLGEALGRAIARALPPATIRA
ncbi:DNA cytosine methyltransferase [Streptomyces sp. NPDC002248]